MKSYEDLNKAEKAKLNTYLLMRNYTKRSLIFLLTFVVVFLATCFICFSMETINGILLGIYSFVIAALLLFVSITKMTDEQKVIKIIFDIENLDEDLFDIKKSDLLNMKRRWINPLKEKK